MKRLTTIFSITALALVCLLGACVKKETPSRVVEIGYPTITLQGPADTTLSRGATWVDPGATWTDSVTGESGTITVSVNTSIDTALLLVYTATDKDGFSSSVTRAVGVTDMNNSIDISGPYLDNAGGVDTLVKVSRAMFRHTNVNLYGNQSYVVIKSDSSFSVATILENNITAPGILLPETFTQVTYSYSRPITFQYVCTILNVPPYTATFTHQII